MVKEQIEEISPHSLDIYISYRRLTAESLGESLLAFGQLANKTAMLYMESLSMRIENLPSLEVDSVHTGDSIKFTFGEGKFPSVTCDANNDIVINIPKKIGIPLLCGFLVLSGYSKILYVHNARLDSQLKKMELIIKQTEVRKFLEDEEKRSHLQRNAESVVNTIRSNPDYEKYKIYDIDVLSIRPEPKPYRRSAQQ